MLIYFPVTKRCQHCVICIKTKQLLMHEQKEILSNHRNNLTGKNQNFTPSTFIRERTIIILNISASILSYLNYNMNVLSDVILIASVCKNDIGCHGCRMRLLI